MPYWFDGNNLIGQSAASSRLDPKTRKSFLLLLSSHAVARGGHFTVFFDGDDPGCGLPPRGVRVRYSAPLSTDDAILREAASARSPSEIIVVTNDRELASRCREAGPKTMTWQQFTEKMTRGFSAREKSASKVEKVNVEEWSRFFGLDPDKLE
jgi:predicted RNA-binding protein with PIN domain